MAKFIANKIVQEIALPNLYSEDLQKKMRMSQQKLIQVKLVKIIMKLCCSFKLKRLVETVFLTKLTLK